MTKKVKTSPKIMFLRHIIKGATAEASFLKYDEVS
jgi:hypothetical protein